jgi:death-on-curing protein
VTEFEYLEMDDVLMLHADLIAESGGASGVRDIGAVESAVAQPQMGFGGQDLYPTLGEKAAALSFSLVSNHAFIDGNKRIGHKAMETFLILNGFEISADLDEAEQTVLRLAASELSREEWTGWVLAHLIEKLS